MKLCILLVLFAVRGTAWSPLLLTARKSTIRRNINRCGVLHLSSEPSKKRPAQDLTGYSFVEGFEYENVEDELMAIGGDPMFLDSSTDQLGANVQVEEVMDAWVEDETAYFDD
jgi:hypothetical protein